MSLIRFALCAALAISLAALAGDARAQEAKDAMPPERPAHAHEQPHPSAGDPHHHGHAAQPGSAEAGLRTVPQTPRAGERTQLTFTLADASGQPVRELMTHHARKLHVFIISADMQVLGHIHPDDFRKPIEGSEATVSFTFPRAGRYLVGADFMTEAGPQGVQFPIDVAGSDELTPVAGTAAPATIRVVELAPHDDYLDPILLQDATKADGYAVSLQQPDAIKAGEPAALVYRFTKDGAPVTDLRPYLEAPLHLVVAKADLSEFQHEHGTVPEEEHAGHGGHGTGPEGHGSPTYDGRLAFGPEVTARLSFPEPGTYYLFGQAAHGDRLLITRFPVEVR
jgi:hypothetical protein